MDAAVGSEDDVHLILPMEEDLTQLKAAAYFVDSLQRSGEEVLPFLRYTHWT